MGVSGLGQQYIGSYPVSLDLGAYKLYDPGRHQLIDHRPRLVYNGF